MKTTLEKTSIKQEQVKKAELLTGAEATAHAMRQINPDVFPVYPITPQTPIIQTFSSLVADGKADSEIINVESEHSAMSAAIGSASAGGRTMTATASQGLALMIENVYIAASMRLPIVVAIGNRALSAPINIHCDHSDSMLARDSGVIQIFVENAQEAYDFMVMAPRLAEQEDILLPVLVNQDGFTITHTAEPVLMLEDDKVRRWVGEYKIPYPLLDQKNKTTQGPFDMPDYYFEHKRQQEEGMSHVFARYEELSREYREISDRHYETVEAYKLEDADRAIVVMGSTAGTVKEVVDRLREKGEKVGVLKIRFFRPFPEQAILKALYSVRKVSVLDRAMSFGSYGPLFMEMAGVLYDMPINLYNYIYGLGGREIYPEDIEKVYKDMKTKNTEKKSYIGLRT